MPNIDVAKLKTELSAIKSKRLEELNFRRPGFSASPERTSNQRAIGKLFETFFTKAGLDVDKLNKMLAQDQGELRGRFQKQAAAAVKYASSIEGSIRQSLKAQRQVLELLPNPNLSYVKVLDAPVLILENPITNLDIFKDSHIESQNSWIKILLYTNTSAGGQTWFTFYFMWTNDSDFPASVSASTSLVLNGYCDVSAAPGIFSGHKNSLYMQADLQVMRWTGWGTDPATGQSIDGTYDYNYQQTQVQYPLWLTVEGGREIIFGGGKDVPQPFAVVPYDLSYNWLAVPGRAVTIFEVNLRISYSLSDPEANISDLVEADFASNDKGYYVKCPQVLLEISPTRPGPIAGR